MIERVVVMGVSGAGKTTLARALADALGWRFIEGDALHPPANVAKMAAAIPLTDEDRRPFLEAVAAALATGAPAVAACSALKRAYRDLLVACAGGPLLFVLPVLDRARLEARMTARTEHFMPPALLDSQLATLEPPDASEMAVVLDGTLDVPAQVAAVLAARPLRRQAAA